MRPREEIQRKEPGQIPALWLVNGFTYLVGKLIHPDSLSVTLDCLRADPFYHLQFFSRIKRTVGLAVFNNRLGSPQPYAQQLLSNGFRISLIDVDGSGIRNKHCIFITRDASVSADTCPVDIETISAASQMIQDFLCMSLNDSLLQFY